MEIEPIAHIESPYLTKFGVPRQPGLAPSVISRIAFDKGIEDVISDLCLQAGDSVIVLWAFSHNVASPDSWSKTIRPPLLGGTKRMGVFASRSSFRPNNLALSTVELLDVSDGCVSFRGGDMVDGTPVFGLLRHGEELSVPSATEGWRSRESWPLLKRVVIPRRFKTLIPRSLRPGLTELLLQDPRPAYTRTGQEGRVFWVAFGSIVVWFTIIDGIAVVRDIAPLDDSQRRHVIETGSFA